jgi:hypothetical protein
MRRFEGKPTMPSLRSIAIACFVLAALPGIAHAGGQKVRVIAPPDARVAMALTAPLAGEGPPILTVFVSPQPNLRAMRRNRALFQTWTGFRYQYSGPRYPF